MRRVVARGVEHARIETTHSVHAALTGQSRKCLGSKPKQLERLGTGAQDYLCHLIRAHNGVAQTCSYRQFHPESY